MAQRRAGTCFLHRPVAPAAVRDAVPAGLALDTWAGSAWVTLSGGPLGLLRTDVAHAPWHVAPGEAEVREDTVIRAHGLSLGAPALVSVAADQDARLWPPVRA